jgi:hypothetical protein
MYSCGDKNEKRQGAKNVGEIVFDIQLNERVAKRLIKLPLSCLTKEYPNKLGQVLGGDEDLKKPSELHPAFYGCFDWHSSVHGHWTLVSLIRQFPNLANKADVINVLSTNLSKENILEEVAYFDDINNKTFERTYGWAWLLKLSEELNSVGQPWADKLYMNLFPLSNLIADKYINFLPKLHYPIRVGEHTNTAFGLSFAFDYAELVKNDTLLNLIKQRARDFYFNDESCPISWEPSGFDFLSPCLEEIDIMRRVLSKAEFMQWIDKFMPGLKSSEYELFPGIVSDRSDGKLVHLDGLNFSRAWVLIGLARQYEEFAHLEKIGDEHIAFSLPQITEDTYEGSHWLGSFALYAFNQKQL